MAPIAPWTRADPRASGRIADVVLVAFHKGALRDDVPMSSARFGSPSAAAIQLSTVTLHTDPSWVDGWRSGGMRSIAIEQLGPRLVDLDEADQCHLIRATIADPLDLTYLQGAWAIARWCVARGASVVLDAFPISFHAGAAVAEQDVARGFDVTREVAVIFETEPSSAALRHVVHTRGLGKLARPELVALVEPGRAGSAAVVLRALAAELAAGYMPVQGAPLPRAPAIPGGVTLRAAGSVGLVEALHLNNDAWLVELPDVGAADS